MALRPLQIQTPQVSLIGGQQLPKASGQGVNAPDISNAFDSFARQLQADGAQNKALDDKLAGQLDMEKYIEANVGKDPLGFYKNPPLVNGSPEYRLAALNTQDNNFIAALSADANTQFGLYQSSLEDGTPAKLAKMAAYADGIVKTIAPEFRERAKVYFSNEIQQRQNLMVAEDDRMQKKALYDGTENRKQDGIRKAISAGGAGADPTPHTNEVYEAIDDQKRLGLINEETATLEKERVTQLVTAAGTQDMIAREAFNGNLSPANLKAFALSLDIGGDVDLVIDSDYEPGFVQADRFDTGQSGKEPRMPRKVINSTRLRAGMDQELATAVSTDLKELANELEADLSANEKRRQYFELTNAARPGDNTRLMPGLQPTAEEVQSEMITLGKAMEDRNGREVLFKMSIANKQMTKVLVEKLQNMMRGTVEEAQVALEFYNRVTNWREGSTEVGQMIKKTLSVEDQNALDAAALAMQDTMSLDAPQRAQSWRQLMNKLTEKTNTIEYWKGEYKSNTGDDFDAEVRSRTTSWYGTDTVPPDIKREIDLAYRNAMTLTPEPNPEKVLVETLNKIAKRYTKNDIYSEKLVRHPGFENPKGYRQQGSILGRLLPANQWINDFSVEQLTNQLDTDNVVFDDSEEGQQMRTQLDAILAAGPMPLGNGLSLRSVPGSEGEGTQFTLEMKLQDGTLVPITVRAPDGRHVPLVIDPGIVLANIKSRRVVMDDLEDLKSTGETQRNSMVMKEYIRSSTGWKALSGLLQKNAGMDEIEFQKWFATRPKEWQRTYLADEEARNEAYRKRALRAQQEVVPLPENMEVSPEILVTPRANGPGVAVGAVQKIGTLFGDDQNTQQYVLNILAAESNFGRHKDTFRPAGDRGLGQVNDGPLGAFLEVQRRAKIPGSAVYDAVAKLRGIGVDIVNMTPSDLEKPLNNVAVARLYIMTQPDSIPTDVAGQAELWKANYNTEDGSGEIKDFIAVANKVLMPAPAYASTGGNEAGLVTDVQGNAYPANFKATQPSTQMAVQRLSAAFGTPLRVTPHGGTQADARSSTSQHHKGTAVDIKIDDMPEVERTRLIALAIQMGFRGIGGYGAGDGKGTIHIDLRAGGRHSGLGLWWRKKPGVDGDWQKGEAWFVEGVSQGMAAIGKHSG